jgi:hypothetical protein
MREDIQDSSDSCVHSGVVGKYRFLVLLDDVELSQVCLTVACESAGACQFGEEVAKSCVVG